MRVGRIRELPLIVEQQEVYGIGRIGREIAELLYQHCQQVRLPRPRGSCHQYLRVGHRTVVDVQLRLHIVAIFSNQEFQPGDVSRCPPAVCHCIKKGIQILFFGQIAYALIYLFGDDSPHDVGVSLVYGTVLVAKFEQGREQRPLIVFRKEAGLYALAGLGQRIGIQVVDATPLRKVQACNEADAHHLIPRKQSSLFVRNLPGEVQLPFKQILQGHDVFYDAFCLFDIVQY